MTTRRKAVVVIKAVRLVAAIAMFGALVAGALGYGAEAQKLAATLTGGLGAVATVGAILKVSYFA